MLFIVFSDAVLLTESRSLRFSAVNHAGKIIKVLRISILIDGDV